MNEESDARRRSNMGFRIVMDIGMGLFYAAIGLWLIIFKAFGKMPVPAWLAWLLGSMMAIGGALRLARGIKAIMPRRNREE